DRDLALMEDRCGEAGFGSGAREELDEVRRGARAPGRDDRDTPRVGDARGEPELEALLRAVAVHRGEEDLAGAARDTADRPFDRVDPGRRSPALDEDLVAVRDPLRVDREHHGLRPRARRDVAQQIRASHGRGVHGHLVRARPQDRSGEVGRVDPAADAEGDRESRGDAGGELDHRAPALVRRGDVEKDKLVGALPVVARRERYGVAAVTEIDEARPLHNAAILHVEAGDDAPREHQAIARTTLCRRRVPASELFSGWNCTPRKPSPPTTDANVAASSRAQWPKWPTPGRTMARDARMVRASLVTATSRAPARRSARSTFARLPTP